MKTYIACNTIVSLLFILGTTTGWAQDVPADTGAVPAWQTDLTGRLSGSQTGFQNWTEGGVNVVSLALGLDGTATHITDGWKQTHQLKVAFGLVKQDTLDFRKAEDIIRISSSFQYAGDGFFRIFNPTIAVSERTQFTEGFNFDKDPLGLGRETPVKVSDFFSPGVFTQSIGLTYQPDGWFTQRLGIGAKETVVLIDRLRPLYGVEPDGAVRFELGIESQTDVDREIFENVRYKSSLGLFAAFNNPDLPDLLWENLIAMKVNEWMNVNFEVVAFYDRDLSTALQIKEVFSLGISFNLI